MKDLAISSFILHPSSFILMKDHWLLDPTITYLNHGSFGATPIAVLAKQDEYRTQLEREPVRTRSYVRYTELFRWPLYLATLALVTELLLAARRGPLP